MVPRLARACALDRPAEARRLISPAISAVSQAQHQLQRGGGRRARHVARHAHPGQRDQGQGKGQLHCALLGNLLGAANSALIPQKLVEGGVDRSAAVSQFGVVCGMTMPMLSLPVVFLGAINLVMVTVRWRPTPFREEASTEVPQLMAMTQARGIDGLGTLAFALVLYLAALQAQGVRALEVLRLDW